MTHRPITDADRELIDAATNTLNQHFELGRHDTAGGLRAASGEIYTSVNLVAPTGPAQIHCEPIALGQAILNGETKFDASVAVGYREEEPTGDPLVLSACGVCRELYREFAPDIDVLVPGDDEPVRVALPELLPAKGW